MKLCKNLLKLKLNFKVLLISILVCIVFVLVGGIDIEKEILSNNYFNFSTKKLLLKDNAIYRYIELFKTLPSKDNTSITSFFHNSRADFDYIQQSSSLKKKFNSRKTKTVQNFYNSNKKKLLSIKKLLDNYKRIEMVKLSFSERMTLDKNTTKVTILLLLDIENNIQNNNKKSILTSYKYLFSHLKLLRSLPSYFFSATGLTMPSLVTHKELLKDKEIYNYVLAEIKEWRNPSVFKMLIKNYYKYNFVELSDSSVRTKMFIKRFALRYKSRKYILFYSEFSLSVNKLVDLCLKSKLYVYFSYHPNSYKNNIRKRYFKYYKNGEQELLNAFSSRKNIKISLWRYLTPNWGWHTIKDTLLENDYAFVSYVKNSKFLHLLYKKEKLKKLVVKTEKK